MDNVKRFAEQYGGLAATIGQKLGVSPDVLLGQWGLETGWGKSVVPGTNNLGNIKDFSGRGTKAKDNMTGSVDAYRVYATPEAFGDDFAGLLSRRYKDALGSGSDATKFASALKANGYAEDPDYVSKLSSAAGMVRKFADKALTAVSGAAHAGTPNMPKIDASQVKWDDAPAPAKIDAAQVKWDDAPVPAVEKDQPGKLASFGASAGRGFGNSMLALQQLAGEGLQAVGADSVGGWLAEDAKQGARRLNAEAKPYSDANPLTAVAGEVTGALANPLNRLIKFGTGMSLLNTVGRGALQGGISGALAPVTEDGNFAKNKLMQIITGAGIGGAVPVVGRGATEGARYVGNTVRSLIDPFTTAGRDRIAGSILQRFSNGAPATANTATLVSGSAPTLAQATANPGLATLERGLQSANPQAANAYAERAIANSAARDAAMTAASGTASDIATAQAARSAQATAQLKAAFQNATPANPQGTLSVIEDILNGPSGKRDSVRAALSNIRSKIVNADGSLEANAETLYNSVRKQIGDLLDARMASSNPAGLQASRELIAVRDALDNDIAAAAPGFGNYLSDFASASKPINAMEYLQGLKLTDAQGNITLAKVQNAISNLMKQRAASGANDAKAVSQAQIDALKGIRDDLLRAAQSGAGKTIGSNTFQNLATNNILENALPGPVRALVGGNTGPVGTLAGRVGNLVYGGSNDAIQNRLLEMTLNPQSGLAALQNVSGNQLTGPLGGNALLQRLAPYLVPSGAIGANMLSRPAGANTP